jgi:hypothetical protein
VRSPSLWRWFIILLLADLAGGVARAQTDSPPAKGDSPPVKAAPSPAASTPKDEREVRGPGGVTEVKPEIFYLRDKNGDFKPVPGFTFEDFEELYKLKNELARAAEPARFGIDQVKLTGVAAGDAANLTAEVAITTHDEGWVRVPLGFSPALLTKPPTYDGPSEQIIQFDAKSDGYVAWLRGVRAKQHVLKMPLVISLDDSGDQTQLKLRLPRTTLASQIDLVVPQARIVIDTPEGTSARTSPTADGKGTAIHITAPPPQFEIGWQVAGEAGSGNARRLVADTTKVQVMVDGQGTRFDATLVVRAVAGPLEAFDVRLPAGASLVPTGQTGYTLRSRTDGNSTIVQVRLPRQTTDSVTLRLVAQRPRASLSAEEPLDLSGFAVIGAARQTGQLLVSVEGDWRIEWKQQRDVREIDPPSDMPEAERDRVVAAYEFFRQPFTLLATVSPQKPHITVDPHYELVVERQRVQLEATLQYMIRGAKVSQLRVALPGWEVVDIGPASLVKPDADLKVDDGILTIPLTQRQRAKVRLTLQASRAIGDAAADIDLELPRPQADVVGAAILSVQPADNVELSPKLAQMPGLVQQPAGGSPLPPSGDWQQPPQSFRQATADAVRYVAARKIRPREIAVDALTDIRLDAIGASVEETLSYRVAHEPLEQVVLNVPVDVIGNRDLKFMIGPTVLTPVSGAEPPNPTAPKTSSPSPVTLRLPKPLVGEFQLQVRFRLPWETGAATLRREVPLVMPAEGTIHKNEAGVSTTAGMQFTVEDSAWEPVQGRNSQIADGQRRLFAAKNRQATLPLGMRSQPVRSTVEFAWIQTWFSGKLRQDRVAYWINSPETTLRIALPVGVKRDDAELWVDGDVRAVKSAEESDSQIIVDLAAGENSRGSSPAVARDYLVELMYRLDSPRSTGSTAIAGPRWLGNTRTYRTVWQVVLPPGEHIVIDPDGFTAEYNWGWYPVLYFGDTPILSYWGRRPRWEQADHQQRLAAPSQADSLKAKSNRYSYSVLGPAEQIEFYTAPRSAILLFASGGALVVGLAFLFASPSRRPVVLLILAVALAGLAVYSPAWAILLAQASSLGLLLVGVAALLKRAVLARRRTVWHGAAGVGVDRSSATHTVHRRDSSSQATTLTAPLDLDAAMDVKP